MELCGGGTYLGAGVEGGSGLESVIAFGSSLTATITREPFLVNLTGVSPEQHLISTESLGLFRTTSRLHLEHSYLFMVVWGFLTSHL